MPRRLPPYVVTEDDRARLVAMVPHLKLKHAARVLIVLLRADGYGPRAIMAQLGTSQETVYRWLDRYRTDGVDALLRDLPRRGGKPQTPDALEAEAVAQTYPPRVGDPPRTSRQVAELTGLSQTTVLKIWKKHGMIPHRCRTFKLSTDRQFRRKLKRAVRLYQQDSKSTHAVVLCLDEKTQIQALRRTQPGFPMQPDRLRTMTHDYRRQGTLTLFAVLNVATGELIGWCAERHSNEELVQFLDLIQPQFPADRPVHVILDNYATHKHQNVREWLEAHPNWQFHFTPTSASWVNAIEGYFARLAQAMRGWGSCSSLAELERRIHRWLDEYNRNPHPFTWNSDPDEIIRAVIRGHMKLAAIHPEYRPPRWCRRHASQAYV